MKREIVVDPQRRGKTLRGEGFQKPATSTETKPVGLAIVYTSSVSEGIIHCSCGWRFNHPRAKVLEDRADTHVKRKHGGSAVWL